LVKTLWVEDGAVLVAVRVDIEAGRNEGALEETVEPERVPEADLQPEPQYVLLFPQ
jgi:hypothetical protein